MKDQIKEILANNTALPVLFVGSGLTRRYLGLPNWEGLLRKFCIGKPFEYYHDKASRECRDDPSMVFPKIAEFIEADFNEVWYTSAEYEESRSNHVEELRQKISPFKICIAEFFRDASKEVQKEYEHEIQLLRQIGNKNISCIVTTNYDCFLEESFGAEQFHPYIGQDELLFSTTYEVGELYKIHGCCTKPESIVINAADYHHFIKKSAYLSSKILTMFLEHPIIFLGYSLSDTDIQRILDSIADCLENDQLNKLSERLIFVRRNHGPQGDTISEHHTMTQSGKTITMKEVKLTDYSELYQAILENNAKYDVKVLRRLKSQLYTLVKENKPTEKLYVATSIEDDSSNVEFVVGVGVYGKFGVVGYRGLRAEELYRYAVGQSELQYDNNMILKEAIPYLYNGRTILPVCYFISQCEDVACLNDCVRKSIKKNFRNFLTSAEKKRIDANGYVEIRGTLLDFYTSHGIQKSLTTVPLLDPNKINAEDLHAMIIKMITDNPKLLDMNATLTNKEVNNKSRLKKCISIWDWLKYGRIANDTIQRLDATAQ